jgi:hypothetical protein
LLKLETLSLFQYQVYIYIPRKYTNTSIPDINIETYRSDSYYTMILYIYTDTAVLFQLRTVQNCKQSISISCQQRILRQCPKRKQPRPQKSANGTEEMVFVP